MQRSLCCFLNYGAANRSGRREGYTRNSISREPKSREGREKINKEWKQERKKKRQQWRNIRKEREKKIRK
jgi:hypothetical protein